MSRREIIILTVAALALVMVVALYIDGEHSYNVGYKYGVRDGRRDAGAVFYSETEPNFVCEQTYRSLIVDAPYAVVWNCKFIVPNNVVAVEWGGVGGTLINSILYAQPVDSNHLEEFWSDEGETQ